MPLNSLPSALFLILLARSTLAAVSTITMSAPAQPTSTSYTSDTTFQTDMLVAHNFYRKEHNVSALTWNDTSAKFAADWAGNCAFKHSHGPTGENLAAGYANASASVDAWGLERENYNWKKPGFAESTGHFTQLVWSNTTSVGCGRKSCQGADGTPGWFVVCEYFPAGNVEGDSNQFFVDNVRQQILGKKTDTVESGVTSMADGGRLGIAVGELRWGGVVLAAAGVLGLGIVW